MDQQEHWNKAYRKDIEKLGWYQEEESEILSLLDGLDLNSEIRFHITGAGRTTLINSLIERSFTSLTLSDISNEALVLLKADHDNFALNLIHDDLRKPKNLVKEEPFDFWLDRAVLHFLTKEEERQGYFNLLKDKTKTNAYVLLAQFKKGGAKKCSGLEVCQYDLTMYEEYLGADFKLLQSFDYTFINPNGDSRPYIYALFQKQ
jgi:hypothetical protein